MSEDKRRACVCIMTLTVHPDLRQSQWTRCSAMQLRVYPAHRKFSSVRTPVHRNGPSGKHQGPSFSQHVLAVLYALNLSTASLSRRPWRAVTPFDLRCPGIPWCSINITKLPLRWVQTLGPKQSGVMLTPRQNPQQTTNIDLNPPKYPGKSRTWAVISHKNRYCHTFREIFWDSRYQSPFPLKTSEKASQKCSATALLGAFPVAVERHVGRRCRRGRRGRAGPGGGRGARGSSRAARSAGGLAG